jgi:hypothetical protein
MAEINKMFGTKFVPLGLMSPLVRFAIAGNASSPIFPTRGITNIFVTG